MGCCLFDTEKLAFVLKKIYECDKIVYGEIFYLLVYLREKIMKKRLKIPKILAFILILVAILSFAVACDESDKDENNKSKNNATKVTSVTPQKENNPLVDRDYYIVTFEGYDETGSRQVLEIYKADLKYGDSLDLSDHPDPKSKWYAFAGWYWDKELTERCNSDSLTIDRDITLYGKWELASYTASFYVQEELIYSEQFNMNSIPVVPAIPEREGYDAKWEGRWTEEDWNKYTTPIDRYFYYIAETTYGNLIGPSNVVVNARYTPIRYEITYENLLDATFDSTTTYTVEDEIVLGEPERVGYTFLGWTYEGQNEPQKQVTISGTIGNKSFTANWAANKYTVTLDANGGVAPETLEVTYRESFILPIPEWAGHTFTGWYNGKSSLSDGIWDRTSDLTLVAKWDAISYDIDYVMNGGINPIENPSVYTADDEFVLVEPKKTGYTFLGWTYEGQSTPQKYVRFSVGTVGNKKFIANWKVNEYTITLNTDGGYLVDSFQTLKVKYGDKFTLPTPKWDGHEFLGWLDYGDGVYNWTYNKTFIASWKAIDYDITYVTDGGSTPTENPSKYNYHDDISFVGSEKVGYAFLGWFDEGGNKVERIKFGSIGNITLYAKWDIATYTVTYQNTGDADLSGFVREYTMFGEGFELPPISVDGYTFNGWLLDGKKVSVIPAGTYGNLVITADLTPWSYQLELETSYGEVDQKTHTVYYGSDYSLPVPSAEGKVFLGWFENVSDSAVAYTDSEGRSIIPYHKPTNRVLYARFAAKKCTVTYQTDGGNEIPASSVNWGTAFDNSVIPTKEGAVFGGWYTENLSTKYTSAYIIHSDITVKAKWITATPISNADEFRKIASNPSGSYYLTNDINLNGAVWSPIGTFSGFLDGNGYSVKNFSISNTSTGNEFGFFCVNNGTIQNIAFEDFTFNVSAYQDRNVSIGVMVGHNGGRMYNCVLKSGSVKVVYTRTLKGTINVGGLVGCNYGVISGCKNLVSVNTTQKGHYDVSEGMSKEEVYTDSSFGGLVGHNVGLIENSSVEATLVYTGSSSGHRKRQMRVNNYVGGLVGFQVSGGRILNCYTSVNLTAATSNIYPSNDDHNEYSKSYLQLGGLIGENSGTISGSYSLGTVKGGYSNWTNVGAFVGYNASRGNIANCYSKANASSSVWCYVGGFVADNYGTIQNSFSSGFVEGAGGLGGFAGRNTSSGTISKCYSTASVKVSSGGGAFFVGTQDGIVLKCYYMKGALLMIGGEYKVYDLEHGSIQSIARDVLWSDIFLKETLYWDDEGWIILHSEDPMLEWEIAVEHDYELIAVDAGCDTVGYTVYSCRHCNRFFVRDIVAPHGHEKTNFIIVPPTCTTQGYNSYYCRRCECSVTENVVAPLGHEKSELLDHKEASCTEDGYDVYSCHACGISGGVIYVIPATGHAEEHIDAVPATCLKAGKTEEIFCSVCGDILKASTAIPPHDLEITVINSADCLNDGLCSKSCRNCDYTEESVVIPAIGHSDVNLDYRCDRCGVLSGKYDENDVIEISTLAELKGIIRNMNGVYRLEADIELPSDWTFIGSQQKPFTGYFDGNGHTITFRTNSGATMMGLFAYNEGIITSLRVVGCDVGVANESCTYGFVAVQNAGYITNCHLSGSFTVHATVYLSSDEYKTLSKDTYFVFGGIVGFNTVNGIVNGCTVDARMSIHTENVAECLAKWSLIDLVRKGSYKQTKVNSMLVINFGAVVGENIGVVEACEVSSVIDGSEKMPEAIVENYYGYAEAYTALYCGEISGNTVSTERDCSFSGEIKLTVFNEPMSGGKDGKLFGYSYEYFQARIIKI